MSFCRSVYILAYHFEADFDDSYLAWHQRAKSRTCLLNLRWKSGSCLLNLSCFLVFSLSQLTAPRRLWNERKRLMSFRPLVFFFRRRLVLQSVSWVTRHFMAVPVILPMLKWMYMPIQPPLQLCCFAVRHALNDILSLIYEIWRWQNIRLQLRCCRKKMTTVNELLQSKYIVWSRRQSIKSARWFSDLLFRSWILWPPLPKLDSLKAVARDAGGAYIALLLSASSSDTAILNQNVSLSKLLYVTWMGVS